MKFLTQRGSKLRQNLDNKLRKGSRRRKKERDKRKKNEKKEDK